eukprot:GHVN01037345.1.p1 GENE.GHVN01037345.1~~GHVN01037345.1.p1  ORF type:complete len:301 (+),score=32.03 GHVN01037345.1:421-1323(+)
MEYEDYLKLYDASLHSQEVPPELRHFLERGFSSIQSDTSSCRSESPSGGNSDLDKVKSSLDKRSSKDRHKKKRKRRRTDSPDNDVPEPKNPAATAPEDKLREHAATVPPVGQPILPSPLIPSPRGQTPVTPTETPLRAPTVVGAHQPRPAQSGALVDHYYTPHSPLNHHVQRAVPSSYPTPYRGAYPSNQQPPLESYQNTGRQTLASTQHHYPPPVDSYQVQHAPQSQQQRQPDAVYYSNTPSAYYQPPTQQAFTVPQYDYQGPHQQEQYGDHYAAYNQQSRPPNLSYNHQSHQYNPSPY